MKWISFSKETPQPLQKVLLFTYDGEICIGYEGKAFWVVGGSVSFDGWNATHWMPLPDKPTSEDDSLDTQRDYLRKLLISKGSLSLYEDEWLLLSETSSVISHFNDIVWMTGIRFKNGEPLIKVNMNIAFGEVKYEEWGLDQLTDTQVLFIIKNI